MVKGIIVHFLTFYLKNLQRPRPISNAVKENSLLSLKYRARVYKNKGNYVFK